MPAYTQLISYVQSIVRTNNNEEITGANLQQVLLDMIGEVGINQFKGIAEPNTDPGTITGQAFYFATTVGLYYNFGVAITIPGVYIITWDADNLEWDILQIDLPDQHARLHAIDSVDDHDYVAVGNRGKLVGTDPTTGGIIFVDPSSIAGVNYWSRDIVNGYIYQANITDRVGIGTVAPSRLLDVNGSLRIRTLTDSPAYTKVLVADDNGNVDSIALTNLSNFWTNLNGNIYNNNAGFVGIGIQNPLFRLQVNGTLASHSIGSQIGFNIMPVTNPVPLTAVISAGGGVNTGLHGYFVTFYTALGETNAVGPLSVTTTTGNNTVTLTIPVSTDPRVIGRKLYRSRVGSAYSEYLLATIANNTATSYVDVATDASLTGLSSIAVYRTNTTSLQITLEGVRSMMIDQNATYFGQYAGVSITTGGYNTLIGTQAGRYTTTGVGNTFVGQQAGALTTTGNNNLVLGLTALYGNTGGSFNIALGSSAGRYYGPTGSTANTNSNQSLFIGNNTRALAINGTNEIVIGYNTVGKGSNTVALGNDAILGTYLKGKVSIGGQAPTYWLDIYSNDAIARFKNLDFSLLITSDFNGGEQGIYEEDDARLIVGTKIGDASIVMLGQDVLYVNQDTQRVGIGVGITSPTSTLQVGGKVTAYTSNYTNVTAVVATRLLGLDANNDLTTNVMPLIFTSIYSHTAGLGLSGSAYNGSAAVSWSVAFGGNGDASTVSRSNHNHDEQYAAYGHNHYLTALADVLIVTLTDGDVLQYNSTGGVWENVQAADIQLWKRDGTNGLIPTQANDPVFVMRDNGHAIVGVSTHNTGIGVNGESLNGMGVYGYGETGGFFEGTGTGIYALSSGTGTAFVAWAYEGLGGDITSQLGPGLSVSSYGDSYGAAIYCENGYGATIGINPASGDDIKRVLILTRSSQGTIEDGIGASVDFIVAASNGSMLVESRFGAYNVNSDYTNYESCFFWQLPVAADIESDRHRLLLHKNGIEVFGETGAILRLKSYHLATMFVPEFLNANESAGGITFDAWSADATYNTIAGVTVKAIGDHSATNQGSQMDFWVTPVDTVAQIKAMSLLNNGRTVGNYGFATPSGDGISTTIYLVNTIGYDGANRDLTIVRSSITISGGLIIAFEELSNIIIDLP